MATTESKALLPAVLLILPILLAACTDGSLEVGGARLHPSAEKGSKGRLEVRMAKDVIAPHIRNKKVVYVGVGACERGAAERYTSAFVDGFSLPSVQLSTRTQELNDPVTLTIEVDEALLNRPCAFVLVTGMFGSGGESRPIPISTGGRRF